MGIFDIGKAKDKGSVEEVTNTAIEKGGVLAILYFDAHGNTPEEVEGLLVNLGQTVAQEKGVIYALSEIDRALQMEDKYFSSGAKVRILADSFKSLVGLCGRYGPMGIEVLKPNEIVLKTGDVHEILFHISEMSHDYTTNMMMKLMKPEERVAFSEKMRHRAEMGKKLMDETEKEQNEKK